MEKQVLTQEELQELTNLRTKRDQIMADFGYIELQIQELELVKETLVENLSALKAEEAQLGTLIQNKYGKISVNMETGEITSVD